MVSKNQDRRARRTFLQTIGAGSLALVAGVSSAVADDGSETGTCTEGDDSTDPDEGWAWDTEGDDSADPDEGWAWDPEN